MPTEVTRDSQSGKSAPAVVLVVDDDPNILAVLEARLEAGGFEPLTASSGEDALRLLARRPVDLVISDVKMPGMGGLGLLSEMNARHPGIPVIMLTAHGSIPDSVEAIKAGAVDYLTKPFEGRELLAKVSRYMTRVREVAAGRGAQREISDVLWGGRAQPMRELYTLIQRVAPSDATVLVTGESGTGKEMVARLIHEFSGRAKGPFVVVDCGSTPATLLESELFGHAKGSFTHAVKDKKGLIEAADGGTLFLDEVGNVSPEMQTRLLRFLQEKTIRRIGDTREMTVDCRVLAATNADLKTMVGEGNFREDLYFRLKVLTLRLPPLRERAEDIPVLAERFLASMATPGRPPAELSPAALRRMQSYTWPGNVRELKHVLEAGVVLSGGGAIEVGDLQLEAEGEGALEPVETNDAGALSLEESEKRAILRALEETGGVLKDAADLLGISRRSIHYKVKKYNIRPTRR